MANQTTWLERHAKLHFFYQMIIWGIENCVADVELVMIEFQPASIFLQLEYQ